MTQLFAQPSEIQSAAPEKVFGQTYRGRYHMPLLPGESGSKAGGNWVPGGVMRMTNLVGALEDTRALSVWEQAMGLIGLALAPELYEELVNVVHIAQADGVDFERLRDYPELKEKLAGAPHDQGKQEKSIVGRAKLRAGANAAAQRGTNRHEAWERRGRFGAMVGTAGVQASVSETERLLADAGLEVIPELCERVVRLPDLNVSGKFDNVLLEQSTGRLLIADLKTKATPFFSWLAVDAQLAGYAHAPAMLAQDGQSYEDGPRHYVDQTEGVILHVPSDGSPARLERADLVAGRYALWIAREIVDLRASGRGVERNSRSAWIPAAQR